MEHGILKKVKTASSVVRSDMEAHPRDRGIKKTKWSKQVIRPDSVARKYDIGLSVLVPDLCLRLAENKVGGEVEAEQKNCDVSHAGPFPRSITAY